VDGVFNGNLRRLGFFFHAAGNYIEVPAGRPRSPAFGNDNVLYHSLLGLTSGQQVCGRFVRNGDYSLKWIAATKCAQWHS
jgi:hypothetical protein